MELNRLQIRIQRIEIHKKHTCSRSEKIFPNFLALTNVIFRDF